MGNDPAPRHRRRVQAVVSESVKRSPAPSDDRNLAPVSSTFRPAFRNVHLMTLVPRYWPRNGLLRTVPEEVRLFATEPGTQLLGYCHWQPHRQSSPTLLLLHGLEGCSNSHYMRGIAEKAYRAGCNVIRMNQRTCGGTEHLTPTFYNSGLSSDYRAILQELASRDGLDRLWLVGYSMGGNLVLKAAGELERSLSALAGVVAVCPNIDPAVCFRELEQPRHWFYHRHILEGLKARVRRKAALFPDRWDTGGLTGITHISDFDDRYTAPDGGYAGASDYYDRSGARHVIESISVPALIITAQDDPFIPFSLFATPAIRQHRHITLAAPAHGGHCGFFQWGQQDEDQYWAEHRVVEFISKR